MKISVGNAEVAFGDAQIGNLPQVEAFGDAQLGNLPQVEPRLLNLGGFRLPHLLACRQGVVRMEVVQEVVDQEVVDLEGFELVRRA